MRLIANCGFQGETEFDDSLIVLIVVGDKHMMILDGSRCDKVDVGVKKSWFHEGESKRSERVSTTLKIPSTSLGGQQKDRRAFRYCPSAMVVGALRLWLTSGCEA
jgi:hypothetical protein